AWRKALPRPASRRSISPESKARRCGSANDLLSLPVNAERDRPHRPRLLASPSLQSRPMTAPAQARSTPRDFTRVETWVFDLDNTLYPHHLNLWQQVDERIRTYIADFLKITKDEAFRVQKDYYKRYGTSMRGMMTEHGM